jgi:CRP-like cAMP-binding protein
MAENNRMLAALSTTDYARLSPHLEQVFLQGDQVLAVLGEQMKYVYFPRRSVVCLRMAMEDGRSLAGATVGNEAVVGLAAYLADGVASDEITCAVPGAAARMATTNFQAAVVASPSLQRFLQRYTLALMLQLARTAGCNRVHSVRERSARWLLMTFDCIGERSFPMTHDGLADMLGVRRASVSEAAEGLQADGVLAYRRGWITICDRDGLAAAACEDYRITHEVYADLYGVPPD